jgi:heme/copper-type cytochrome/quinol oxidase subunit 3
MFFYVVAILFLLLEQFALCLAAESSILCKQEYAQYKLERKPSCMIRVFFFLLSEILIFNLTFMLYFSEFILRFNRHY